MGYDLSMPFRGGPRIFPEGDYPMATQLQDNLQPLVERFEALRRSL